MSTIAEITQPLIDLVFLRNRHYKVVRVEEITKLSFVEVVFSDSGPTDGIRLYPGLLRDLLAFPRFDHIRVVSKNEIIVRLVTD